MSHRVVITGAGCVTPLGAGVQELWRNLLLGRSGVGPITLFEAGSFPVRIAAEVRDWDLRQEGVDPDRWRSAPRQTHFAIGSVLQAVRQAGLEPGRTDPTRIGVYLGCGEVFVDLQELGQSIAKSVVEGRLDQGRFVRDSLARSCPEQCLEMAPDMASCHVASILEAQGPTANFITACTSSTQAVGNAAMVIRRGEADVMLAGGAHSMIHPLGVSGLYQLGVLSTANDKPEEAMRPFTRDRDGFVVAEGGGAVVLESLEHARSRGAEILAELAGYASVNDGFSISSPHTEGRGLSTCIANALNDAHLSTENIDYINAHGTSTPINDRVETLAIKRVFGRRAYAIPVSSTKSMLGHCTTACGILDLIACVMAIRSGTIPPTINYDRPDPACDLDYVPNTARKKTCRRVLSNNLGFGGQNAALVLSGL